MNAAFLASFMFVVLAEMGDKTQLLAMAFGARYSAAKVLIAVFIATIINHGLAVAAGRLLVSVVPFGIISFAAALSFIGFGLWTLKGDECGDEAGKESRFGPIATVAIAFFLAEMGDKTQLATVSLAVRYESPFGVLMGTTLGMLVADAIGITAGAILRRNVQERTVKWISALVFIGFGLAGCWNALAGRFGLLTAAGGTGAITLLTAFLAAAILRSCRSPGPG